jgi:hypothetical protein
MRRSCLPHSIHTSIKMLKIRLETDFQDWLRKLPTYRISIPIVGQRYIDIEYTNSCYTFRS